VRLYLLDTNIASYIIKGTVPGIRRHLERVPIELISVSAVTEGELRYGVARRPEALRLKLIVDEFLRQVAISPWDSKAAQCYGQLRARLESKGMTLENLDLMIAAHALAIGATLVTHDQGFSRVEKLKTADWTKP
jgi:tRNA(fMet)-specific endonuclease VapC